MNMVLIGSTGRCGIYEYSQILLDGFQRTGYPARYVGVKNRDNEDLARQIKQLGSEDQIIIFEYEPGIFELRGLVKQMIWLRLAGKRVVLSIHETEPAKYPEYRHIMERISQPARFANLLLEVLRLVWAGLDVSRRYFELRLYLLLLGWLPHVILVHSLKTRRNVGLLVTQSDKIVSIPYIIKQLQGDRTEIRARLQLPQDRFAYIIAGFIFRRKQILEVIQQLPANSELWIVGTPSEFDPGYLEEIQAYLAQNNYAGRVRLFQEYELMEQYLLAADVSVLYYKDMFQSGIAAHSIGAGKPCIFSNLPGFADYHQAGIVAHNPTSLKHAMEEIRDETVYSRLQAGALQIRAQFAPEVVAEQYARAVTVGDKKLPPGETVRLLH